MLEHYTPEKIVQIDATMSQIKVLGAIMEVIVPLKSDIDHVTKPPSEAG